MTIPSIIMAALYAYTPIDAENGVTIVKLFTYDATVGILIMFLGSALAFMIMKWRAKSIWDSSLAAQERHRRHPVDVDHRGHLLGVPGASTSTCSSGRSLYGAEQRQSAIFMAIPLRSRARDLDHRLGDAQASGHGPRGGRQGDPGRVTAHPKHETPVASTVHGDGRLAGP